MKSLKKIFALLIAMVMVLGMSTSVFAAGDGSITIQNTVKEKTYTVYKVFDATYSGDKVAYTYDGSNRTFLTALQGDSSPFTVTANTAKHYNVALKDGKTPSDVSTFLKAQEANLGNAVKTETGDGKTKTINGLDYGYYYITTTTGTTVTIDSAIPSATVIDKNEVIPPPDKAEQVANGTWTEEPKSTNVNESTTGNIGDTVNYKVTGSFNRYQGEDLVTKITFTDTMSEGLTPNKDVVIKINGNEVNVTPTYSNNDRTWTAEITTATEGNDGIITFNYDSPSTYEITYSAVINENAKIANSENNTFTLKYNDEGDQSDTTEVVTYRIDLEKVDLSETKLAGAKFKLYDEKTGGKEIPVVLVPLNVAHGATTDENYGTENSKVDNVYRHAKTGETAVEMVTGATGKIIVQGLANGSYYFEETEAPKGFNKLTARTDATTITDKNATIKVTNMSGAELPSTGGIGTTIFYIIGAILVIGAGVVLVTRRRMNVQ